MRIYLLLIAVALTMLVVVINYSLNLGEIPEQGKQPSFSIAKIENEINSLSPVSTIDIFKILPVGQFKQLVAPQLSLAHYHIYKYDKVRAVNTQMTECHFNSEQFSHPDLIKADLWSKFICNKVSKLPNNFHELASPIHPNGKSYAWLELKRGAKSVRWTEENLARFHLMEWASLAKKFPTLFQTMERMIISQMSAGQLSSLSKESSHILTDNYLLVQAADAENKSSLEYNIYERHQINTIISNSPIVIEELKENSSCLLSMGSICWNYNYKEIKERFRTTSLIIIISAGIIILLILWILYLKLITSNKEHERKKWALRVLTHELRTPITSLLLQIERFQQQFDQLSPEIQELVIELSGNIHRLKRLAETSRTYLEVSGEDRLVRTNYQAINSLNSYFEAILEEYPQMEKLLLTTDNKFNLDPYWTGICVKNLIENAINHGAPPYKFRIETIQDKLEISVTDSGVCQFENLNDFSKGQSSKGLGLGIDIVKIVVKEMDGQLTFTPTPTTFKITVTDGVHRA